MLGILHAFVLLKPYLKKALKTQDRLAKAQNAIMRGCKQGPGIIEKLPLMSSQDSVRMVEVASGVSRVNHSSSKVFQKT